MARIISCYGRGVDRTRMKVENCMVCRKRMPPNPLLPSELERAGWEKLRQRRFYRWGPKPSGQQELKRWQAACILQGRTCTEDEWVCPDCSRRRSEAAL
jgi:hypothetical protein